MAELTERIDQSRTFFGMDSFSDPQSLEPIEYIASQNTVSRGGLVQTRPGSRVMSCAPSHENGQGLTFFQPTGGAPHLVLAVDGYVYVAPAPFTQFSRLEGIRFSPYSKYITFAVCLQSTDYDVNGVLFALASPRSVLVMQDGQTKAAYWDGTVARHLNPETSPVTPLWITAAVLDTNGTFVQGWSTPVTFASGTFVAPVALGTQTVKVVYLRSETQPAVPTDAAGTGWSLDVPTDGTKQGYDETRIGLWMAWSNNRLWVSRGGQVFASDIGNPLKFTEAQYLAEGRAFYLQDDCTGIVELTDQSGILVFTSDDATIIRSSITDRTQWLSTPDFQKVVLQKIGCVAPRSIQVQYGLIWWFSAKGITNLDASLRQNLTSKMLLLDMEMAASKGNVSPDFSMICGAFYENYLLMSVPSGDVWNRHTWVLDQDPFPATGVSANSWNSWWTGWRPIEWARGIVEGNERLFFLSRDYDNKLRVWEAMTPDRTDNGCAITCVVQTREHNFGDMMLKRFRFAELYLREIYGTAHLMVAYKAQKAAWTRILTKQIEATAGQIYNDGVYGDGANLLVGNRPQSRTVKTSETAVMDVPCQEDCGVESPEIPPYIDRAFGLLVVWSGRLGLYGYRMFVMPESDNDRTGFCEQDEVGPRSVARNGASALSLFTSCNPFPDIDGAGTASADNESCGGTAVFNETATSIISQADADQKAECLANVKAQCYADGICGNPVFCNVEQTVNVSVNCGNGIRVCDGSVPVSIACSSLTGDGQLCGFSGYDDGSYDAMNPEAWAGQYRKWKTRTLSGSISQVSYEGLGCSGTQICFYPSSFPFRAEGSSGKSWSGSAEVDCSGGTTIWASEVTNDYGFGSGPCTITPSAPSDTRSISSVFNANVSTVFTLTTKTVSGLGCVNETNPLAQRASSSTTGTAQEVLSEEQTIASSISGGVAGSSCQTVWPTISTTTPEDIYAISFTGATSVTDTFTIGSVDTPLVPGETYTATVTLTKTPQAGGDPVLETVEIEFVADAAVDTITYEVPMEPGYNIQVTNVEVVAGNIPCEGSVSASYTVAANTFCADAQVRADQAAYNFAIQQATAAAQAQLSCIYGNEAQSYTATCPGTLVSGGVVPPGSAIGNPVTVTIPAGTYTASTVEAANALALADATSQANAALECFWTNTAQTAEYCCEFVVFVSGAGLAEANGSYYYAGIINGKPKYNLGGNEALGVIYWTGTIWVLDVASITIYFSSSNTAYPWEATWIDSEEFYLPTPSFDQNCAQSTVPFNTYNSDISQADADLLAYAAALAAAEASIDCTSDVSDGGGEAIIL